jgi:hypothetical protein
MSATLDRGYPRVWRSRPACLSCLRSPLTDRRIGDPSLRVISSCRGLARPRSTEGQEARQPLGARPGRTPRPLVLPAASSPLLTSWERGRDSSMRLYVDSPTSPVLLRWTATVLTSIVPDLPCLLVMVCILAKGSGGCASPGYHDHPPQRLLQNFADTAEVQSGSQ